MKTLILIILFGNSLFAQFITKDNKEIMDKTYEGMEYIYSIKPDKAKAVFEELIKKYPDHPFGHFGYAMSKWAELEYLEEESSPALFDDYKKLTDKAIDVGKAWVKKNPNDANAYMCLGGTYGLMARLYIMKHSWLNAYIFGKKAVNNMRQALNVDPELYDAYLGIGTWEYYAGTLPGVIRWLAKLVVNGNAEKGIEYLKLCAEKGHFNRTAAELLLIEIYTQTNGKYSNPKLAVEWSKKLVEQYPLLAQMQYVLVVSLYESKDYDAAEKEMIEYLKRIDDKMESYYPKFYPRAYTSLGTLYMMKKDYDKAILYLNRARDYIKEEKHPSRWAVWGVVRLGNIYDLMGERNKALSFYKEALSYNDQWGFKDYIEQYLKKPFLLTVNTIATQLPPP